ncbi:hypothetical protein XELAEV_18023175mg [Xenopus laevis]|uniref:Uncharacterized protein n=1 Tax=Xenopus laevis TaxID=8355 RepID=A0A974D3Q9_XENLA|nr:hypothetical protein XELAEV_18023175mg [Xenopus laevis]
MSGEFLGVTCELVMKAMSLCISFVSFIIMFWRLYWLKITLRVTIIHNKYAFTPAIVFCSCICRNAQKVSNCSYFFQNRF